MGRAQNTAFALVLMMAGAGVAILCIAGLLQVRTDIAAGATSVIVYYGDVSGLFAGLSLTMMLSVELIRPGEWWLKRIVGLSVGFMFGALLAPVAFGWLMTSVLEERGYARCPGRVTGYTLPASRWVKIPSVCRQPVAP